MILIPTRACVLYCRAPLFFWGGTFLSNSAVGFWPSCEYTPISSEFSIGQVVSTNQFLMNLGHALSCDLAYSLKTLRIDVTLFVFSKSACKQNARSHLHRCTLPFYIYTCVCCKFLRSFKSCLRFCTPR